MKFPSRHGRQGVALVVVLWAVALISTATFGLATLLQRQLGQEVAALQNARAILVAESGIQMALNQGLSPAQTREAALQLSQLLQQGWQVPVRFEVLATGLVEEESKINLNALLLGDREFARRVLTNLFTQWEVNATTSSRVIDAMLDWVDADRLTTGNEDATEDYTQLPPGPQRGAGPRNAPMESVNELSKVLGWDQLLQEAGNPSWRNKFTVYGSGKLSLRFADQDVIEAWLDLPRGGANAFLLARPGPDGVLGNEDDVVNPGLLGPSGGWDQRVSVAGGSDLWRVTSTGTVGKVKRKVVALVSRNPPSVKARWVEADSP